MSTPVGPESQRVANHEATVASLQQQLAAGKVPSLQAEREIEDMMQAIFNERCPGIRFDDRDVPLYRKAAIAALNVLGILSHE